MATKTRKRGDFGSGTMHFAGDVPAPGILTRIKYAAFGMADRVAGKHGDEGKLVAPPEYNRGGFLWCFATTIGELNAIWPFLEAIFEAKPALTPVIISDHPEYVDAFLRRLPKAAIFIASGRYRDATMLASRLPPAILILAEVPAILHDGPCRLPFAFIMEAKRRRAALYLANGWLYGQHPSCRMDALEKRLFSHAALDLYDGLGVQTENVASRLIEAGADPNRIRVTGNLKFETAATFRWSAQQARSPHLIGSLAEGNRPVLVAGCVTSDSEQAVIVDAYQRVSRRHTDALLIIAPRYPNLLDRMESLAALLRRNALSTQWRSSMDDEPLDQTTQCLVLDTVGELRDFYAVATLAHVGRNHNLLEPLAFGKPVTASPGWNESYSGYPVYRILCDHDAFGEYGNAQSLAQAWIDLMRSAPAKDPEQSHHQSVFDPLRGALDAHLELLAPWLESH